MKADKLDKLTAAHGRTRKVAEPTAAVEPEAAKPNTDLDDHATQERIRNPEGCDVALSYGTLHLFPPTLAVRREIFSFCTTVYADAGSTNAPNKAVFVMRLAARINRRPVLNEMFPLIAYLCGRPGTIDVKTANELAAEIDSNASTDDNIKLFEHLTNAADMFPVGEQQAKN